MGLDNAADGHLPADSALEVRSSESRDALQERHPAFDRPEVVVSDQFELYDRAKQHRFADIEGLECRYLHAEISFDAKGEPQVSPAAISDPRLLSSGGSWPLLDHTPQLKSLILQPPNSLNAEGWRRIRSLQQLEVLQLEHIYVSPEDQSKLESLLAIRFRHCQPATAEPQQFQRSLRLEAPPAAKCRIPRTGVQFPDGNEPRNAGTVVTESAYARAAHSRQLPLLDRLIETLGKIRRLRRLMICSSSKQDAWKESQRQVEFLRERLPGLNIERGVFSHNRVILHLFLSFLGALLPFVAWFQSGLKLSQPLAAVIPGHRGPHLFWPVIISTSCAMVVIWLSVQSGTFLGCRCVAGCDASDAGRVDFAGHDLTESWRKVIQYISMIDVICLLLCITLALAAPYHADAYLMGDYQVLAIVLMLWFVAAGAWKIWRATRLHQILAESGMPGIPGLNVGMHQAMNQPFVPAPGWSLAKWQLQRMQNAIDRKIAKMDRSNWVEMLRQASPSIPACGWDW